MECEGNDNLKRLRKRKWNVNDILLTYPFPFFGLGFNLNPPTICLESFTADEWFYDLIVGQEAAIRLVIKLVLARFLTHSLAIIHKI